MPKTLNEVSRDAAALGLTDQLKLAHLLLIKVEAPLEPSYDDAEWDREIEHRLEELQSGKAKGIPLADFKKRVETKFGW